MPRLSVADCTAILKALEERPVPSAPASAGRRPTPTAPRAGLRQ